MTAHILIVAGASRVGKRLDACPQWLRVSLFDQGRFPTRLQLVRRTPHHPPRLWPMHDYAERMPQAFALWDQLLPISRAASEVMPMIALRAQMTGWIGSSLEDLAQWASIGRRLILRASLPNIR